MFAVGGRRRATDYSRTPRALGAGWSRPGTRVRLASTAAHGLTIEETLAKPGAGRRTTSERVRAWTGGTKPAAAPPSGVLVAHFSDGPLSGSTHEVTPIEGRPPKTVELLCGERTARYCLVEWEQSGHTAVYGYLYDV